mmetsp:Transcript_3079/g.7699  ORF Transcript_3079/g.7699 Transcript_3079/m.7699 type:complete len:277 (+) Transcript_3079:244-1074(+)
MPQEEALERVQHRSSAFLRRNLVCADSLRVPTHERLGAVCLLLSPIDKVGQNGVIRVQHVPEAWAEGASDEVQSADRRHNADFHSVVNDCGALPYRTPKVECVVVSAAVPSSLLRRVPFHFPDVLRVLTDGLHKVPQRLVAAEPDELEGHGLEHEVERHHRVAGGACLVCHDVLFRPLLVEAALQQVHRPDRDPPHILVLDVLVHDVGVEHGGGIVNYEDKLLIPLGGIGVAECACLALHIRARHVEGAVRVHGPPVTRLRQLSRTTNLKSELGWE